jgi:hypothetical protein
MEKHKAASFSASSALLGVLCVALLRSRTEKQNTQRTEKIEMACG